MIALLVMLLCCLPAASLATPYPIELLSTGPMCFGSCEVTIDGPSGPIFDDDSDEDDLFAAVAASVSGSDRYAQADGEAEIDGYPWPYTKAYHAGLAFTCEGAASSTASGDPPTVEVHYFSITDSGVGATDLLIVQSNPYPNTTIVGECYIDFGAAVSSSNAGITGGASLVLGPFGNITMNYTQSGGSHYGSYSTLQGYVSVGTVGSPTPSPDGSYVAQAPLATNDQISYAVSCGVGSAGGGGSPASSCNISQFVSVAFFAFTVP